jgi:YegS/Rv2252/BmrU family lipid kinase
LLIVNPGARRAAGAREGAITAFQRAGVPCDVVITQSAGHATQVTRERATDYDAVFTLGGDGTAMEVITALADGGPPVGILAGGTGNVLARSFGIPLRVSKAVPALLEGDTAHIDLGRLSDGRHFAIGIGVGLDEAMIAGASRMMKKRAGLLAYVWSATRALAKLDRFHVRLTVDGATHEREVASVLIANLGTVLGGVMQLGHGILHDDGLLHACLFSPRTRGDALRIFTRMLRGTAHLDACAFYVPGKTFRLETDPPRRAQADGELLESTPLDITVRPRAASLLIPRGKASRR